METRIIKVENDSAMQAFLDVPYTVYREGEVPLQADRWTVSLRFTPLVNPILQHVRLANFVALDRGRGVGRITASVDDLNPRRWEGFWGCFECIDSAPVAEALLAAAAGWLREQNKTVMIGPATLTTSEQVGLLIEGFEQQPPPELPFNPPYYRGLTESAGLVKVQDLECYRWRLPEVLPDALVKKEPVGSVTTRPINYDDIAGEAELVQKIYNKAFNDIWGFIPMTLMDTRAFIKGMAQKVPEWMFILVQVDDRPAGMGLAIPYKEPAGQGGRGKLARIAFGGVVSEFRHKRAHLPLIKEFFVQCKRHSFVGGEVSQVAESNDGVKSKVVKPFMSNDLVRVHRVYRREL